MRTVLTIGTRNSGKLAEIASMLADLRLDLHHLADSVPDVEESGATFAENAAIKASAYARLTETYVLADDSGLEVAALGGRPGVLSARYGGEGTGFDEKMSLLLREIEQAGSSDRRARFVCSLVLAAPDGSLIHAVEGISDGMIATEPRGGRGFGYDPLFIPAGDDRTFGELTEREKSEISHRARAFRKIIPFLRDFFAILT